MTLMSACHVRRARSGATTDTASSTIGLATPSEVSASVQLWQPPHGGHVGFASGAWPAHVQAMPLAVTEWLEQWL